MKLIKQIPVVLLLYSAAANIGLAARKEPAWESGKVVSQDLTSSKAGVYAAPIGTAAIAVPIYRRSNRVVIETDTQILEWVEVGQRALILPVHGTVEFYRDGDWFIVLDTKNKKHKFALTSMRNK